MAYAAELRGFEEEAGLVAPAELAVGADVDRVALEHGGEHLGRDVGVVDQEGQAGVAVNQTTNGECPERTLAFRALPFVSAFWFRVSGFPKFSSFHHSSC